MELNQIYQGDTLQVLKTWPDDLVDTIITSPPYWGLRDYGVEGQISLEKTLDEFLGKMLKVTKELQRVLKPTGVMFWNHGDCYSGGGGNFGTTGALARESRQHRGSRAKLGIPTKSLCLQNYRLIFKMIDEQGWILRNSIIWHKPNPMPSSVKDRFSNSYEPVFMLVKKKKYWFDLDAVRKAYSESSKDRFKSGGGKRSMSLNWREHKRQWNRNRDLDEMVKVGKNPGDVWKIATQPFPEAHFATFPEKLILPMIKSSCPQWICKKCEKARERISETTIKKQKSKRTWEKGTFRGYKGKRWDVTKRETIGWTDCGCKAGWQAGIVLDPFMGSGTTALVVRKLARNWLGIELSKEYIKITEKRLQQQHLGI